MVLLFSIKMLLLSDSCCFISFLYLFCYMNHCLKSVFQITFVSTSSLSYFFVCLKINENQLKSMKIMKITENQWIYNGIERNLMKINEILWISKKINEHRWKHKEKHWKSMKSIKHNADLFWAPAFLIRVLY